MELELIGWLLKGLPLSPTPYRDIAEDVGCSEAEVLSAIATLRKQGAIKRDGIIVRHHKVGYRANAMCVWDIPDDEVSEIGKKMATFDFVTLCYRRPRREPDWPYNLFCMIHGKSRQETLGHIDILIKEVGLEAVRRDVLFSTRSFKQQGAAYGIAPASKKAS